MRKKLCLRFLLLALALSLTGAAGVTAWEPACEVCYDTDLCIPVLEEWGYQHCWENYEQCYYYVTPNGIRLLKCVIICKNSSPCLLPPGI